MLDDYTRLMSFERVPEAELRPGMDYARIHQGGAQGLNTAGTWDVPFPPTEASVPMRFKLHRDWKGDELNSWYVAITRARLRLELPKRFWHLYRAVAWRGLLARPRRQELTRVHSRGDRRHQRTAAQDEARAATGWT